MKRVCWLAAISIALLPGASKPAKPADTSPLDRYIDEALRGQGGNSGWQPTPGSTWMPTSRLADPARDLRANQVDDLVTIVVVERASAVSSGKVKSNRQSAVRAGVSAIGGVTRASGPLANLARASSSAELEGEGETSRETIVSTVLSARVTHVLPNGYLVIEGVKDVQVNSERQQVMVRGVIRPADLSPDNAVESDRLAQLEVRVNGRGVVSDAIRRPFILYRILMGLLPF